MLIARSRLTDLEGKLDGILSSLESRNDAPPTPKSSSISETRIASIAPSRHALDSSPATGTLKSCNDFDTICQNASTTQDWASRLELDEHLLEDLLQRFRKMQHHFPFVVVHTHWSVAGMLQSRPCLLLAAVADAASHYPELQERLAKELRNLFARQIVVDGESSLDLLQALLVHLAW